MNLKLMRGSLILRFSSLLALVVLLAAVWGATVTWTAAPKPAHAADDGLVLRNDANCTVCHDKADGPELLKIGGTKHGTLADSRTPTCISCHGDSAAHEDDPINNAPDMIFGGRATMPAHARGDTCLACHSGRERMFWSSGTHAARDLACESCHRIHTDRDAVTARRTQSAVCFTCHKTQRAQSMKPSRHPIREGQVACSDCHNPHGSPGHASLSRDSVNDTCFMCHAEKREPFIWNHQPVTEDCSICHEPHGTVTANLLRWRVPFLCQSCHEEVNHQGRIPRVGARGTGGVLGGANVLMARGCLNCHGNIHGGNNPVNHPGARSFQR